MKRDDLNCTFAACNILFIIIIKIIIWISRKYEQVWNTNIYLQFLFGSGPEINVFVILRNVDLSVLIMNKQRILSNRD